MSSRKSQNIKKQTYASPVEWLQLIVHDGLPGGAVEVDVGRPERGQESLVVGVGGREPGQLEEVGRDDVVPVEVVPEEVLVSGPGLLRKLSEYLCEQ